jgi:hypothetical protein
MTVLPLASIPVGVLAERKPAMNAWADPVWAITEILLDVPAVPDWTVLRQDGPRVVFFAGVAEIKLFRTETSNLKHNMDAAEPRLWAVLRPTEATPGMALQLVTADPGEAHLFADSGNCLVESLPMPAPVAEAIQAFIAAHHQDQQYYKRKRDRADPDALGRRSRVEMDDE